MIFSYHRKVQFYETDLMGIVHHSNYIRFFEEARVAFAFHKGILDYQKPETASHLAVLETGCKHLKPCFFGDELDTLVQVKLEGIRIHFQYKIINQTKGGLAAAVGFSSHVPLDSRLRPVRPLANVVQAMEKETWTETWL